MRKDFKRVLAQKQRAEKLRDEWCDAYTNMRDFAKSKELDTTTTNRK
jgi:methylaspartate ammonia-lyase